MARGLLVAVSIYLLLLGCATAFARLVPDSFERAWLDNLDDNSVSRPRDHGTASAILGRLLKVSTSRDLNYRVHNARHGRSNAWAIPGGAILITGPLLRDLKTETGLAFVLAHELEHHELRHPLKRLARGLLVTLPMEQMLGRANLEFTGEALTLYELAYDRQQELEADAGALRRVRAAFGTTDGALEVLDLMAARGGDDGMFVLAQTHPVTKERIARLRSLARELN